MEEAIRAEMAPLDAALHSPPWSCGLFWSLRPALVPPFPVASPVTPQVCPFTTQVCVRVNGNRAGTALCRLCCVEGTPSGVGTHPRHRYLTGRLSCGPSHC